MLRRLAGAGPNNRGTRVKRSFNGNRDRGAGPVSVINNNAARFTILARVHARGKESAKVETAFSRARATTNRSVNQT